MKFLKWFLFSLCLIFVVLVAVFYANKLQEKRMLTLQNEIYTYLHGMKQLETMSLDYQKEIDLWAKIIPNVVSPNIINDIESRNIYSFSGTVSAGIDFNKLVQTGLILEKWFLITIDLPDTEILKTVISHLPTEINGKIVQSDDKLLEQASKQAMQAMKDAAISQNIIEIAKVNAEKKIKEDLLKKYTNVKEVIFK